MIECQRPNAKNEKPKTFTLTIVSCLQDKVVSSVLKKQNGKDNL